MKKLNIIVNGTQHEVEKGDISFDNVVAHAYASPPYGDNTLFSVTYRRGHCNKPEGILAPDTSVKVQDGMVFDVTATDKS